MKDLPLKKLLIILSIFLIIIFSLLLLIRIFVKDKNQDNDKKVNNLNNEIITENEGQNQNQNISNNTLDFEIGNVLENTIQDNENDNNTVKTVNRLVRKYNKSDYFLIKKCMELYYDSFDDVSYVLDKEVKKYFNIDENNPNITENNILKIFKNLELKTFCIDEIYEQNIDEQKSIYLVYYREENKTFSINKSVLLLKIDRLNKTFSVYPFEYLSKENKNELKEGDIIELSNLKEDIPENKINKIADKINTDGETVLREFVRRYRFDLMFDYEHLYSCLDEEYKKAKFPQYDDLLKYIEKNKTDLTLDKVNKFGINEYSLYTQFVGISDRGCYIFNARNMMDYSLLLDNYTIIDNNVKEMYNSSFPKAKAEYCINRMIKAINDKNYSFVYDRLNPVQKNNYYKNFEEFENFLKSNFYELNEVEFNDYLKISDDVYQYNVKITDKSKSIFSYKIFTITVNIKDDGEFLASININK